MDPQQQQVPYTQQGPVYGGQMQPDMAQAPNGMQMQTQQQQQPQAAVINDKQAFATHEQQPMQPGPIMARPGANYQNATPLASLQKFPAPVDCPLCNVREMTIVSEETGGYTHAMAAIACFCCCLGCIPYMMSSFKNVQHRCGSCGGPLALWHRSGSTEVLAHR